MPVVHVALRLMAIIELFMLDAVTGVVVSAGPGRMACVPAGSNMTSAASRPTSLKPATDLIVDADAQTTDDSTTLLVIVQCVHKVILHLLHPSSWQHHAGMK